MRSAGRGRPPGRGRLTGQVVAHAFSTVRVRDLPLLEGIESIVADTATARRQSIRWHVDSDNSAWQQVREEAIRQAVEQARHYAAALGGAITAVEHVADLGL